MKTLHLSAAVLLAASLSGVSATARPVDATQLQELYDVVASDTTDVASRLRLAGVLQELGYETEAKAIMTEVAAITGDVDLVVSPEDGCPECVDRGTSVGPDVIVGDLNGIAYYGRIDTDPTAGEAWMHAFSTGTTSCNIGNQQLLWISNTNDHPVIGQTIYRVWDGRIRHIGQSWLKHGFFALSQNLCSGGGCQGTNGSSLGIDCSDPYTASRNGQQGNLGPKWQVDATTGEFPYPPANPPIQPTLGRRIQVAQENLNPATYPGAIYVTEGQYVQFQDSQFNNDDNNSSYRRFTYNYNNGVVSAVLFNGTTQRMRNPIDAWTDLVAGVQKTNIVVNNDSTINGNFYNGLLVLGTKTFDNGDGTWDYEYALYNMNSHSSVRRFLIPVPASATISNVGFHDVNYHSGEATNNFGSNTTNFSGDDWANTINGQGFLQWTTQTVDQNLQANAIRWGTTYNFYFTADAAPTDVMGEVRLFRPLGNTSVDPFATQGPDCLLVWDLDGDDSVGFPDLNMLLDAYGTTYDFSDLNELLDAYGDSCN